MNINNTLTKENFWNEIMELFPHATADFCQWIDEYKKKVSWNNLFGEVFKFHHLPYEMQQGVWVCYVENTLHRFFEQPEYEYNFDLEEDIKLVFGEIEEACKEEQENNL